MAGFVCCARFAARRDILCPPRRLFTATVDINAAVSSVDDDVSR